MSNMQSFKRCAKWHLGKTEGLVPPPPEDAEKYGIQLKKEFHGTDGPLPKSFPIWYPELHIPFLKTLSELGLPVNPDPVSDMRYISTLLLKLSFCAVLGPECRLLYRVVFYQSNDSNSSICHDCKWCHPLCTCIKCIWNNSVGILWAKCGASESPPFGGSSSYESLDQTWRGWCSCDRYWIR